MSMKHVEWKPPFLCTYSISLFYPIILTCIFVGTTKQATHLLTKNSTFDALNVSFNVNRRLIKALEMWIDNQKPIMLAKKNQLPPNIMTTHLTKPAAIQIIRQEKNDENSYISPCQNILLKNSSKRNQKFFKIS